MKRLYSEEEIARLIEEATADLQKVIDEFTQQFPVHLGLQKDPESSSVAIQWTGSYSTTLHLSCPLGDAMGIEEIIDAMIK